MKKRNLISLVAVLSLTVSILLTPVLADARGSKKVSGYDWNRGQIQGEVSKAFNQRMEKIHYYDTRGRKYREDRVYIDLNTGRRTWEYNVPRNRW